MFQMTSVHKTMTPSEGAATGGGKLMEVADGVHELRLSEIIKDQAIVNVGMIGHVAHGKSTATRRLTGVVTQRDSSERNSNGRTIKLGYANAKIFRNRDTGECQVAPSTTERLVDEETGQELELVMHFSIPDCPGHHEFMATMLAGSTVMDQAILVVAANDGVPQPQTRQHLAAMARTKVERYLVLHNKLDLLTREQACEHHRQLTEYLAGTPARGAPIMPISAERQFNMDRVVDYLAHDLTAGLARDYHSPVSMTIVRSFGVNHSKSDPTGLKGAVVGGTIQRGILTRGDLVELRPGIMRPHPETGESVWQPLYARVVSIESSAGHKLNQAVPGGLVGVELSIDSGLAAADRLQGFTLGHVHSLPPTYDQFQADFELFEGASDKLLVQGARVQLVSGGSMVTSAKIVNRAKKGGRLTVRPAKPLVLDLDDSPLVALLVNNQLVASLKPIKGTSLDYFQPEEVKVWSAGFTRPTYRVIDDLSREHIAVKPNYEDMLNAITFNTGKTSMLKLEPCHIKRLTKHEVAFSNCQALFEAMRFSTHPKETGTFMEPKELLLSFIQAELPMAQARYNGKGHMILRGRITAGQVNSLVSKFLQRVYYCPSCRLSVQCNICKPARTKLYHRYCTRCKAVTTTPKLF